ncbi:MAG: aldo/keto reductase [Deltaproteobacteria bacterium]|nr:aldo/keto reductase [Deltaproteobacteria bacterium]
MKGFNKKEYTRRQFIKKTALTAAGLSLGPFIHIGRAKAAASLMKRPMGRLNFEATTLGLGGQASLQWTPVNVDPVKIILKAFASGINYYDTSNFYDDSQLHYGKAFRRLDLIPETPGYNETLRRSIFLTSKTCLRFGKGGWKNDVMYNLTNGSGTHAVSDVKRTLSQIFGDGKGAYPKGAYLDMVLMHAVTSTEDIDALYAGYENTDQKAETIGTLATLIDLRDGTNLTGLNPGEERLVRHIGFSGHASPAVMMEMIHRDTRKVLEGMLVAINANDRNYFNMQYNIIPVAEANNMGIIGMKVFADGAMYEKPAVMTQGPHMVVRRVGSEKLPSRKLVEYSLTTPGIHTAIIGTGHIDNDPKACQLTQNLLSAQIMPDAYTVSDRREVERLALSAKEGKTNGFFQVEKQALGAPRDLTLAQEREDKKRMIRLKWQTSYAGDEPIMHYEIWRDNMKVGQVAHKPQLARVPFTHEDILSDNNSHTYRLVTVDASERTAKTEEIRLAGI